MKDIAAWQREFYATPAVWAVFDRDGCLSNLYESKEAAQLEVNRNPPCSRIVKYHVHSLDLARRRWGWPLTSVASAPQAPPDSPSASASAVPAPLHTEEK